MTAAGGGVPSERYQIVDVVERWEGDSEVRVPAGAGVSAAAKRGCRWRRHRGKPRRKKASSKPWLPGS